ncbi:sulfotransferase 1C4-like [Palaemon carinicauda]|uniref:sulfotransferase 1C4-like n=1 Tax=Palaemon carinicauda TaxID=392227 RepID=UPI0035B5DCC5
MELITGHVANPIDGFERDKLLNDFRGYTKGLIRLTPGRWLLSQGFTNFASRIYNFQHKVSDVMVMTWPKCGTTWMQEIVWTMRNNPNLDNPDAELPIDVKSPYFELDAFLPQFKTKDVYSASNPLFDAFKRWCPGRQAEDGMYLQLSECLPDHRVLKTHLPFSLLSPSLLDITKVVYVARNPKDVIVSYHHHSRINRGQAYVGTFEDFVQYFVDDDLLYGPYWSHVEEAWKRRNHPNLHFVFYEDLKKNPLGEIRVLDSFLNSNLTEAQLERIVRYTSFEEMQGRGNAVVPDVPVGSVQVKVFDEKLIRQEGGFFRKGESGDWKSKLTPDMDAKVDQWIHKNLDGLGIKFNYEISNK